MATSTFEKEIIIDNEAAERLIAALRQSTCQQSNPTTAKLRLLAVRAQRVRVDSVLRHEPNAHDLRKASENAEIMAQPQFQTIKSDGRVQ
ncbi:MAG: hypothetical protein LBS51_01175 [Oscillospiraceae bacterium]|jgi:bifunctional ADP-heptose synthase (sugar kinase/adenylyltransferase)|nr:hypothetical protein [Oscillospiraceae bacterium]